MRCPRCAELVSDHAQQCPHCSYDLRAPSEVTTTLSAHDAIPEPDFPPGSDFTGRFMIIEKAGRGGMATVYKARDKVLEQEVALKLIHPELARVPTFVERFKREVRVTRQITHPNVCRIHDLGESAGRLYFSMQWISGETLKDLLGKAGRLDQERALEIAEKVALALDAVHSKDVTHRDLKPGNVMIDQSGEVFVMDFGVATERGASDITSPGMVEGTLLYMAPEQRRGEKVDGRADLYALGLILEEMLTSQRPGPRRDAEHIAYPNGAVASVLEKLLAHDRQWRYPSAKTAALALHDLREQSGSKAAPGIPPKPPHRVRWALAGLALAIIVAAFVIFSPGAHPRPEAQVYYERGVHYLREESETLRSLDEAIVMLQRSLEKDSTAAATWAVLGEAYWTRYDRFDRKKDAPSRTEAARAVKRALALDADLPEVHNAIARGLIAEGDYRGAVRELEIAVSREPRFDAAWVNLGRAYQNLGEYAKGLDALQKAVRLNPTSFRNYISLGNFHLRGEQYGEAEKAYRMATDLKPDSPLAWRNLGACLLYQGFAEKAAFALIRSLDYEESARTRTNLGIAYQYMARYDSAAVQLRKAADLEPANPNPWGSLGDALALLGNPAEAKTAYETAVRLGRDRMEASPMNPATHSDLAGWCAKAGDLACASSEAARALAIQPQDVHVLFANALVRCVQGRDDDALDLLDRAVRLGLGRAEVMNDPVFVRFRENPRFKKILELAS